MAGIHLERGRIIVAAGSILLFLLLSVRVFSQPKIDARVDSMMRLLSKAKEDTAKVLLLCSISLKYPEYDPNKGCELAKEALQLSQLLQYNKGIGRANISFGLNEVGRANYEAAKKCFGTALETGRAIHSKEIEGSALKNLGITCYYQANNLEGLKYLFDALSVVEGLHAGKEIYEVEEFIGMIYESQKNYEKALLYYKKSYEAAVAAGLSSAKCKNLINIGQVYLQMERVDDALTQFLDALVSGKEQHDDAGVAVALADLGIVYNQRHQYAEALEKNYQALAIYNSYADRYNIANIYGNLGKVFLSVSGDTSGNPLPDSLRDKRRSLDKAFAYFNKATDMCKGLSNLDGVYSCFSDLSKAWELKGNYREALKMYKACVLLRDSIYSSDNNVKIANLETSREIELKDKQLEIEKLELAKRRNENVFFLSGIGVLLVVTLILYRSFSTQKKLNATITQLVSEQELVIEARTKALTQANKKLVDLIQFNVHNLREPITRIMGLLLLKKDVEKEEFYETIIPMMEQSVTDLDNTLKEAITTSEQTTK